MVPGAVIQPCFTGAEHRLKQLVWQMSGAQHREATKPHQVHRFSRSVTWLLSKSHLFCFYGPCFLPRGRKFLTLSRCLKSLPSIWKSEPEKRPLRAEPQETRQPLRGVTPTAEGAGGGQRRPPLCEQDSGGHLVGHAHEVCVRGTLWNHSWNCVPRFRRQTC